LPFQLSAGRHEVFRCSIGEFMRNFSGIVSMPGKTGEKCCSVNLSDLSVYIDLLLRQKSRMQQHKSTQFLSGTQSKVLLARYHFSKRKMTGRIKKALLGIYFWRYLKL
jgi:hypothetical protein